MTPEPLTAWAFLARVLGAKKSCRAIVLTKLEAWSVQALGAFYLRR